MKKIKLNKKVVIGLLCVYAVSSTAILGGLYAKQTKQNGIVIQTNLELNERINYISEEVEIANSAVEGLRTENAELISNLDSARQRNGEITREIEELEEVERQFVLSRGRVQSMYFTTTNDITRITIDNGDLLDLGLRGKLKGHGWDFVNAGVKYGIDPLFLAAISAQESGWGKYDHGRNNIFGISSGAKGFSSYADCIDYTASLLAEYYVAEGRTTPAAIQPKYCPSPNDWHFKVAACANTILNGI